MKKRVKFCPRCGAQLNIIDAYCIRCGYNFIGRRGKKLNIGQILIAFIALAAIWIIIRLVLNRPIIPQEVADLVKTTIATFTNKTR
jgi:ribosomal protein L40E